jgi:hypothetical protein
LTGRGEQAEKCPTSRGTPRRGCAADIERLGDVRRAHALEDMLLKDEMTSCFSEEPTATAVEMQPGAEIALVKPLLPAAIAVATPTPLRLSMLALRLSLASTDRGGPRTR